MRLAVVLFMVIAVFFVVSATKSDHFRGVFKHPDLPGKCVLGGLILEKGQTARQPTSCVQFVCHDKSEAEIQLCDEVELPPGKKYGKDTAPNADYPACCQRDIINE